MNLMLVAVLAVPVCVMAVLVWHPRLRKLAQDSRALRAGLLLAVGGIALVTYPGPYALAADFIGLDNFYHSDSTHWEGSGPGIVDAYREFYASHTGAIVVELWMRHWVPAVAPGNTPWHCYAEEARVCAVTQLYQFNVESGFEGDVRAEQSGYLQWMQLALCSVLPAIGALGLAWVLMR